MRPGWLIVYKKEISEFARDRRVLFSSVLFPMLLVLVLMNSMGAVTRLISRSDRTSIVVRNKKFGSAVLSSKDAKEGLSVQEVSSLADGKQRIADKKAKLFIDFRTDLAKEVDQGKRVTLDVYLDSKEIPSQMALRKFHSIVDKVNEGQRDKILATKNLTAKDLEPVTIKEISTSPKGNIGSEMLIGLLPYFLILFSFLGGQSQAGDMVAGEKERGTLETLLVSPLDRAQIAIGKLLSMATICFASATSAMLGVALAGITNPGMVSEGLHLSPVGLLVIIGTMIPLVIMFASMMLAISAYARNQREATTYASAISFVVIVPAVISQFIGLTDFGQQWWIGLVPILNSATVLRQALLGDINWSVFGFTLATTLTLGAIALSLSVRMFQRERVLFRV